MRIALAVVMLASGVVLASDPKPSPAERDAIEAFKAGHVEYKLRTTPSGVRWFATDPGRCTCDMGKIVTFCSADLDAELLAAKNARDDAAKVGCPPNAGCAMGVRRIYVACKQRKPRPKK